MLEVESPIGIPDHFTLVLTSDGNQTATCEVKWRKPKRVGVTFV
jgi:hypothetical protein